MENTIFNFEIIKETDKAVYIKVPYWEENNVQNSMYKQLFFETWVPRYSLNDLQKCKEICVMNSETRRLSHPIQKLQQYPNERYQRFGEYAPTYIK